MNKLQLTLLMFLIVISSGFSQERFTLSGTITDLKSNETLIGVNVFIPEINAGTTTNEYGFYSITIPQGTYKVQISYLGYLTSEQEINLDRNIKNNFSLSSEEEKIEEVTINDERKATNIRKAEMSVNKLSMATIKKMPVVLGETDVLKSILLLPGVTNAGEGSSGFNVRGGAADQNLILLDEASIFNS